MNNHFILKLGGLLLLAGAVVFLPGAVPQQTQSQPQEQKKDESKDKKTEQKPAEKTDKPAPLFEGSMNLRFSRQKKDEAALGFNGLDKDGKVERAFLESSPTQKDTDKAQQLAQLQVDRAELEAFLKEGKLNPPKQ